MILRAIQTRLDSILNKGAGSLSDMISYQRHISSYSRFVVAARLP